MQELLEYVIKSIVEDPEEVSVTAQTSPEGIVTYNLRVAPNEVGLLIGKGGKNIQAIRALARMKATLTNERVRVEIAEDLPPQ